MIEQAEDGQLSPQTVENELNILVARGHVTLERDVRDPFSRTRIVELPPKGPTKSNPVAKKGKSYASHVEDGWGADFELDPDFSLN